MTTKTEAPPTATEEELYGPPETPPPANAVEVKVFAKHQPTEMAVHITIAGTGKVFGELLKTLDWLAIHDFVAHEGFNTPKPDPNAPKCADCGAAMNLREGVSKNGAQWKGYFCPNSKKGQDGHKPQWVED